MVRIDTIAEILNGDRSAKYPSGNDFKLSGIPFINAGHLNSGSIDFSNMDYISEEKYNQLSGAKIQPNDILLCLRGSLGKYAFASFYGGAPASSIAIIRSKSNLVDAEYLLHIVSSSIFQSQINIENNGSSQPNLSASSVANFLIPLPTLDEQKKISEALSGVDDLIFTLEKQIVKKNAVKQGVMQELLSGKRRLKGFSKKWKSFNLMKGSKIKARIGWQGLKKSEYLDSGYAFLVTGTDFVDGRVKWDTCHFVERERYNQDENIQIKNGDILVTKDGTLGKTAFVQGLTRPATLNSGVFVIRPLQNAYDPEFVYHILSSFIFKEFLDKLSAGSTIVHLYQKDMGKFEFLLPPTLDEQKAIATILTEMDEEIKKLEEKYEKYTAIKQGMMEQLLTGKIRLV